MSVFFKLGHLPKTIHHFAVEKASKQFITKYRPQQSLSSSSRSVVTLIWNWRVLVKVISPGENACGKCENFALLTDGQWQLELPNLKSDESSSGSTVRLERSISFSVQRSWIYHCSCATMCYLWTTL